MTTKAPFSFQTSLVTGMLRMSQFNQPLIYLTTLAQLVCFYFVLKRRLLKYHFPYSIRLIRLPKETMKLLSRLALCKPRLAAIGGSCCLKKSHAFIALDSCLESASRVLNSGNKRPLFPFCSCFTFWTAWKLEYCNTKTSSTRYIVKASPVLFKQPF